LTRAAVLASGVATEAELDAMQAELDAEFEAAVEFAKNSPVPDLSEVTTDIYGAA
jgi:pyruvate dehydrogenase E1 component alpha subunit